MGSMLLNLKKILKSGFQEFREFDYGIDIKENIILIQDEIVQGLTFDVIW
jgi:hypothetical protein